MDVKDGRTLLKEHHQILSVFFQRWSIFVHLFYREKLVPSFLEINIQMHTIIKQCILLHVAHKSRIHIHNYLFSRLSCVSIKWVEKRHTYKTERMDSNPSKPSLACIYCTLNFIEYSMCILLPKWNSHLHSHFVRFQPYFRVETVQWKNIHTSFQWQEFSTRNPKWKILKW